MLGHKSIRWDEKSLSHFVFQIQSMAGCLFMILCVVVSELKSLIQISCDSHGVEEFGSN